MNRDALLRLADSGIAAFPPVELHHLADWCWDFGESTGDARYSSLARSIYIIADLFDLNGAAETATVRQLDTVLNRSIGEILEAESAELGAHLARTMRESIGRIA